MSSRIEVFRVEGMHCGACSAAVERSLNRIEGVEASVSLPAETATVRFADDTVAFEELADRVEAAGFRLSRRDATGDRAERERARLRRETEKVDRARNRMVVAWSLTLPIMLWMIPEMVAGVPWPDPLLNQSASGGRRWIGNSSSNPLIIVGNLQSGQCSHRGASLA